jgi:FkbM family methyltransferase
MLSESNGKSGIRLPYPRVIYDLGSNNGDDLPYYLKKADRVVAVEANPVLAQAITQRFMREIAEKRLFVENCVLIAAESPHIAATPPQIVPFYLHKNNHKLSQLPKPTEKNLANFEEVFLPSKSVSSLVGTYGEAFYVKIDLEHYDEVILKELFERGIRPPYISVEAHSIGVFCTLVSLGKYNAFKIVDGSTVAEKYRDRVIDSNAGPTTYSFPDHSAGPFGDDVDGPWMTASNFFYLLAFERLGWKDIHATTQIRPDPMAVPRFGTRAEFERAVRMRAATLLKTTAPKIVLDAAKFLRRVFPGRPKATRS